MKKITIALLLLSQLSLFAQDYKFGKVSKEELEEKYYPLDSTADAAYLYRERRTYYNFIKNEGFQLVTKIHERIKIYTKEGFDMATKPVAYYDPENGDEESVNSIKGYTYSLVKGKVVKEKLSKNNIFKEKKNKSYSIKKITMPNIKVGTVIEIKYELISPFINFIDDLQFQYGIPVKKLNYQIEIPEYFTFNKRSKGYYSVQMKKSAKNGIVGSTNFRIDVFSFEGNKIPALRDDEPFISSIHNYRGGLEFELTQTNFLSIQGELKNYSNTWETVSKQIFKSSRFGTELNKSNYYKEDLEKILEVSKTRTEKIASIFQFVKKQVKWNGVYGKYTDKGVRKAYKERVGNVADINLILTSMLRSAGLDANPVLVSTRNNGVPMFPTLDGFNYVISMVEFKDGTYLLLDATELFSLPNILPTRVLNWNGRKVTKEGNSSWIKLTPSKFASEENLIMVKVTQDLIVEGFVRTKYDNLNALNFRNNYNHIKEENLITKFEENNKVEIINFKITNKYEIGKPVNSTLKFSSEDLIEEISNKLYIEPLLFLTEHENPFKLEERKFPIDFASPWKDKNTVSIQIPEGYKVEKLPESFAISLPDNLGVFKYQVTQMGKKISTIAILQFNSAIIGAENYKVLKDFYGQMVKKQSEKIVLIKL
ncbi:DUF3857 and transglutaminase domain-containing protein [Polaribacter butkevichii]|uniref:DUF3857 domain-containing protein n=1 Tax=Polaribacter butkevichii TaxID=218490 RepID=A0A2P6CA75_9FLAO|nr:DUF3857 and transglutaminase domain-containing protein [Polaribacter butkevichii]PQJ71758.1 hypothetical protein BTO14_00160 [Polaribacter butkevichii]